MVSVYHVKKPHLLEKKKIYVLVLQDMIIWEVSTMELHSNVELVLPNVMNVKQLPPIVLVTHEEGILKKYCDFAFRCGKLPKGNRIGGIM